MLGYCHISTMHLQLQLWPWGGGGLYTYGIHFVGIIRYNAGTVLPSRMEKDLHRYTLTNRPFSVMCFTSTPHLRVVIHNMQSTYSTETIQHKLYVCVMPTSTCSSAYDTCALYIPLFPPHYQYLDQPYHFEKMASPPPLQPNQPLKSHQHTPFPPKAKHGGRKLSTCQTLQDPMTRNITGDTLCAHILRK